ncbi:MAG: TrmH family RNA methyltransferase [Pirellulales bacterium]
MSEFVHQRHKPPAPLARPRELVLACAPMRSNVNLSRIARAASAAAAERLVLCGAAKILKKIARDGAESLPVEVHRTLAPTLGELRRQGYALVGLEQTTGSQSLYSFPFPRRTVLVVGNERTGLTDEELRLLDHVVEIPVYGLPYSHNVATAASMAIYEYCRQYPEG